MPLYATPAQLADEPDAPTLEGDQAERLLRRASTVVELLTRGVVYHADRDGIATDPDVQGRLTRATLAQAVLLAHLDANRAADGPTAWDSVSIGGVSLSGRRVASGLEVAGYPVAEDTMAELSLLGPPTVARS